MLLLSVGCDSNNICVNVGNQMLHSTDDALITKLYIEEEGGITIIIEKKKGKKALSSLNLQKLDTLNYAFHEIGFKNKLINQFSLNPNSTYHIDNTSIGDAASIGVTVETGANGLIISSNKVCN